MQHPAATCPAVPTQKGRDGRIRSRPSLSCGGVLRGFYGPFLCGVSFPTAPARISTRRSTRCTACSNVNGSSCGARPSLPTGRMVSVWGSYAQRTGNRSYCECIGTTLSVVAPGRLPTVPGLFDARGRNHPPPALSSRAGALGYLPGPFGDIGTYGPKMTHFFALLPRPVRFRVPGR
jgi:hypothetical protein